MTSIVGIRCSDGVVIGADSSTTFGDGMGQRIIEQTTDRKIEIVGEMVIVAGTGGVGLHHRYVAAVNDMYAKGEFKGDALKVGNALSQAGLKEFGSTFVHYLDYAALVAFPANDLPVLCELPGGNMNRQGPPGTAFQPELKKPEEHWFVSCGSGQPITDPFLALLRKVFWLDGPPQLQGGIFTALWALQHACEVNPGGIKEPIKIAVLARDKKGKLRARMLSSDDLAEAGNIVSDATKHMASFRDVILGKAAGEVPSPPKA